MTDSFPWEEMPTRNNETGNITNAGYIPIVQNHTKNIVSIVIAFHGIQTAVGEIRLLWGGFLKPAIKLRKKS
jgi:hypothetical protein